MSLRGTTRKRVVDPAKELEEYLSKRRRNNDSVYRTRQKKRQEETDTIKRVEQLKAENAELERKVEGLSRELAFLKDLFVAYAKNGQIKSNGESSSSICKNDTVSDQCTSRSTIEENVSSRAFR